MIDRFHVTPADLLGAGGESEGVDLDHARVLRIYKPQAPVDYIERRSAFYGLLHTQRPPFELPLILESGMAGGRSYTVERRMRGRDFAGVCPRLRARIANGRSRVISMQHDSWAQFLWDRLQQTYRVSQADVEQDVPGIDVVLAHVRAQLRGLDGFREKHLVHDDYFPANVYIDDDLTICGVGDFGYTTVRAIRAWT